ncbi:hypothetical protein [Novosphingobium sp. MMS21-SN21R]|uniref:hypothetical protein n=1 Tax=Novosphingobium sp. MMS21-SN21R TaxID=2969298 RepID=UPI0028887485|nr:hypothetical protein [Novosphingobium sp. MMS21-SN21R]MDT0506940.1 hypothetical protein [Novosphingobium sp. MMS21-SN21R]
MQRTAKWLGAVSGASLVALSISPAYAAGTAAGTQITNTATVSFKVEGLSQNAVSGSDTFTVDRKVDILVAEVGNTTTQVSPGQAQAVTTFEVTNLSNATLDVALAASQLTGGTGPHGGTDNFDVSAVKIYLDNGDGIFNATTDTLVSYVDELGADQKKTVFIVADVALDRVTADVAAVTLTATAAEGGTTGTQGAIVAKTTTANTSGIDTVFADGAGAEDSLYDGKYSARDDYTVLAAALSVAKTSRIVSDPVNGTTNPKFIPGAVVEYCIAVTNAAGSATAADVGVNDPLPSQITYSSTFGVKVDGTVTSGLCTAGTLNGTYTAGTTTVSGVIPQVSAGQTKTLIFQATIK